MKVIAILSVLFSAVFFFAGCQTTPKPEGPAVEEDQGLKFVVSFPAETRAELLSGRVLLFFSESEDGQPRKQINWFDPSPVYAVDVEDLGPGDRVEFSRENLDDPDDLAFPGRWTRLEPGTYRVQALINHDQPRRDFNDGPGNLFSEPLNVAITKGMDATFELMADQIVEIEELEETDWVKFVKVRSELLGDFHGREVFMRAGILLPSGYDDESDREYPAYYVVPGFGGRHMGMLKRDERDE